MAQVSVVHTKFPCADCPLWRVAYVGEAQEMTAHLPPPGPVEHNQVIAPLMT